MLQFWVGLPGMEVASSLIEVATRVTVVTMDSVPFQLQLGERVGMYLRQWHEARGVRLVRLIEFYIGRQQAGMDRSLTWGERSCDRGKIW